MMIKRKIYYTLDDGSFIRKSSKMDYEEFKTDFASEVLKGGNVSDKKEILYNGFGAVIGFIREIDVYKSNWIKKEI